MNRAPRARSFWGPDGEWDWDADPGQRWMLLAARERGARVFEAFSNSPPFWMTVSGRASGHVLPFRGNLRAEREPDFVEYLVAVLARFRNVHGLTFRCMPCASPRNALTGCSQVLLCTGTAT